MAGRGRGRGKSVSFDVQALGFGRGEALPAANLQPPPLFPTQEFKPIPLAQTEDYEYMLALKQEFIATLHKSPYYLKLDDKKRDIERYSDKYNLNQQDCSELIEIDWRRVPAELKVKANKVRKTRRVVKPNIQPRKTSAKTEVLKDEIVKKFETLEKKEETGVEVEDAEGEKDEEEEEGEKDEEQENMEGEEIFDEDDLEEETDYAFSYFDNGEGYGDDDGDDDEGPIY